MNDRFKFRFWNSLSKQYENTYDLKSCEVLDYVIPEQCTGLKDKNGKLIYEGDIVDFDDSETYATIEWGEEDGCWQIITTEKTIYTFDNLYGYELTVIGNIHENPELLGEQMSKDRPKVGDVFNIIFPEYTVLAAVIEDTDKETRILRRYKYDFEKRYTYDVATINKKVESDYYNAVFHKRATHLGKSETNIDDLFKTENKK